MIKNIFSTIKTALIKLMQLIKSIPAQLFNNFSELKAKLGNMTESNLQNGMHHLYRGNYKDAIFRFNFVKKWIDKENKEANYMLAWCHLMQNNYNAALASAIAAGDADVLDLQQFIQNKDNIEEIPEAIYIKHRDIGAANYIDNFVSDSMSITEILVSDLQKNYEILLESCKILELGCNIGLLGNEIKQKLPADINITGVEISEELIESMEEYYPNNFIYDEIIHALPADFIEKNKNKFDVILSLDGLPPKKDISDFVKKIHKTMQKNGYFAFRAEISDVNKLRSKTLNFSYSQGYLINILEKNNFKILSINEINMENKNNSSIFICTK